MIQSVSIRTFLNQVNKSNEKNEKRGKTFPGSRDRAVARAYLKNKALVNKKRQHLVVSFNFI